MRGFTLIELLVVFLIMTGVLAIGVSLMSGGTVGTSAEKDVRGLVSALREARSQSILRNREVVVEISTDSGTYGIANSEVQGRLESGATVSLVVASIEQTNENTGGFRFFPDGSSTGGEINISGDTGAYVVKVEWLTGRVAVAH